MKPWTMPDSTLRSRLSDAIALAPRFPARADEGARVVKWSAAVAIVLAPRTEWGPAVLLTRRTPHLIHHPGQISFPGGRCEAEETALAAALRETEEEVGLPREALEPIGELPHYVTVTGYEVSPWLLWCPEVPPLRPDPFEVAETWWLPLTQWVPAQRFQRHQLEHAGQRYGFWALAWRHYFVWGATAAMLRQLGLALEAAGK